MSILINGMEMPKACWECPLKVHLFQQLWCTPSNKVINRNDNTEREPDCPLVEVPTPHGRLIDAEPLEEILTTAIRNMKGVAKFLSIEDDPEIKMEIKAYTDILNGVKEQLTIIEAEGRENENNNV